MKDRSQLDALRMEPSLRGTELAIRSDAGVLNYRLVRLLGQGKTSAAWEAISSGPIERKWAIKFVLRSDYQRHTLYAEAARVNQLNSPLIARIEFYGEPEFTVGGLP